MANQSQGKHCVPTTGGRVQLPLNAAAPSGASAASSRSPARKRKPDRALSIELIDYVLAGELRSRIPASEYSFV